MPTFLHNESLTISHLTDVEGNLRYFREWAERSNHLHLDETGQLNFRSPLPGNHFVYGGDFCDKGPGDLRVGRALVDFKLRHPECVSLIAGNREIKCRRFTYELGSNIRARLLHGPSAWWNKTAFPRDYVVKKMQAEGMQTVTENDIKRYLSRQSIETCQSIYLKWMLTETMGCGSYGHKPDTFEYRRMELAAINKASLKTISDEAVAESFLNSVAPEGLVTAYLKQAQPSKIIGETLFIHGAVTPDNMGYVPGMSESSARMTNAREWLEALNDWYVRQIQEWISAPYEETLHAPGHKPLERYIVCNAQSMITANWYRHGKLAPLCPEVVKFLTSGGIHRVVCGHQPFSDFPLILRSDDLDVFVGDTGYSDPEALEDNRGRALHHLIVHQEPDRRYVSIFAIRQDGTSMQLQVPTLGSDRPIGYFTSDGWLIRPLNEQELISSQLQGYQVLDKKF